MSVSVAAAARVGSSSGPAGSAPLAGAAGPVAVVGAGVAAAAGWPEAPVRAGEEAPGVGSGLSFSINWGQQARSVVGQVTDESIIRLVGRLLIGNLPAEGRSKI